MQKTKTDTVEAWNIDKSSFPEKASLSQKIRFLLGYAILAPSTHNSQPWLFRVEKNSCKIFYNPTLRLQEADPKQRDLYISMGCCLENLCIAARYFGMFQRVQYHNSKNLVAEVFFQETRSGHEPDDGTKKLLESIPQRITARGQFNKKRVSESVFKAVKSVGNDEGIRIDFITDSSRIDQLARLTAQGLKIAHENPSFRKEMSQWMSSSFSTRREGLPGYSLRMPAFLSLIIPRAVRFLNLGHLLAKLNYKSLTSVPLICVLSAGEDSTMGWLKAGQLAERLMLTCTVHGLKTSIFVAAIEMDDLYKDVQKVLQTDLIPQFLFCAGYMDFLQKPSPRYSVESKLIP